MRVSRRRFVAAGLSATVATAALSAKKAPAANTAVPGTKSPFPLKFAPHFGMFKHLGGKGLIDQLQFAADQGFTAWEDNGMKSRSVEVQNKIARTMRQLNMEMGVISALRGVWNEVNFAGDDEAARNKILKAIKEAVEVARRVNAKYLTVVPGLAHPKLPEGYQTANCVELLKRCCDIVEPHGLTMVIEPLNRKTNHPGVFLYRSPQAYMVCKAVNRRSCKILFDIYHQQITEGNLIPNIDRCWDQIGYFQCADNPGRKEPGTGEINYANVFRHIRRKGFSGIIGMEHGNSKPGAEGENCVIAAYRRIARELNEERP